MNKFLLFIGVLCVLGAFAYLSLTAQKKQALTNYPSNGTDIIAFGDSLIAGTGASSLEKTFVSILSEKVGRPIVNLGVPGDTTSMGIERLSVFNTYHPKVVMLLLGGNDHLKKVPIEETFANLSYIIEDLHRRSTVVLLLGVKGNLLGDKFEPEFEKLVEKYHVAYVPDVLDGLFGNPEYMADSVHPNDAGNALIAERIFPVLASLVR